MKRPWWWWINPWLYIFRRDKAYEESLSIIEELAQELYKKEKIS